MLVLIAQPALSMPPKRGTQSASPQLKIMTDKQTKAYRRVNPQLDDTLGVLNKILIKAADVGTAHDNHLKLECDPSLSLEFYEKLTANPRSTPSFLLEFIEKDTELRELLQSTTKLVSTWRNTLPKFEIIQKPYTSVTQAFETAKNNSPELYDLLETLSTYPEQIKTLEEEVTSNREKISKVPLPQTTEYQQCINEALELIKTLLELKENELQQIQTTLQNAKDQLAKIKQNPEEHQKYEGLEALTMAQELIESYGEPIRLKELLVLLSKLKDKKDPTEVERNLWNHINGHKKSLTYLCEFMTIVEPEINDS